MTTTAKLLENGRSQAVRLPREFRFKGDARRECAALGEGCWWKRPVFTDVAAWFAELDRLASEPLDAGGPPAAFHSRARRL